MSVDLYMYPAMRMMHDELWAATCLSVQGPSNEIWREIRKLPSSPVTSFCFGDEDPYTDDEYGERLRWVRAGDLAKIRIPPSYSARMKAAFAYVRALEEDAPVVLYWH